VSELGHQAQAAWASFANKNLKNTSLPVPIPEEKQREHAPKTLPHALSRAAKSGAQELGAEDKLGAALATYATAMDKVSGSRAERACVSPETHRDAPSTSCVAWTKANTQVGDARLAQDSLIAERFVTPWQATLSTSIGLAMKARANVKTARLELDSARAALKSATPAKQEQARLHVEEAEDKLVQGTETAIGLMKAVLENVSVLRAGPRSGAASLDLCCWAAS
jgi:hypothetical protein